MAGYDIYIQPIPSSRVTGLKCYEFGYRSAVKVRGMHSLIIRWVKILLTPRGSDLLLPDSGTALASLVGNNITSLTSDVQDIVVLSIDDANEQIRAQDTEGFYPENERLQNAYLVRYEPDVAGFNVWIHIDNAVGESLEAPLIQLETRG